MYKFFFLINPISGGGQGKVIHQFLPEIMHSEGFDENSWHAEFTEYERIEQQIKNAIETTKTLIVVGGDGTVSAVLSVLLNAKLDLDLKIGLIPLGTGNDLARVLNLYKTYTDKGLLFLLRRLIRAKAEPFDIWKVNDKYALANYFSGGIDARIAHDFNQDRSSGKIASHSVIANKIHYVKRFFADRNYQLQKGTLSYTDKYGKTHTQSLNNHRTIIVGNIPSFASGSNPFYKSNTKDGFLEVVDVPNMFNFLMAIALGTFPLLGNFLKRRFLKSLKVHSLELEFAEDEFLQLDGEDLTGKLNGKIKIEFARQVQMLALSE